MKKTEQTQTQPQQPRAKLAVRPNPKNQVLPPLTPEEQSKRGQTLKDLTSYPVNQVLKKSQKPSNIRLPKLEQQLKPRNSAKSSSKENEQISLSSTLTGSASKSRQLKSVDTSDYTNESQESSFSHEPQDSRVGINIIKALKNQKEAGAVEKFLEECGLPKYAEVLKEHGFDDLETIMEIQVKHLVDMRIPSGHQVKITRRIEQIKNGDKNSITDYIKPGDSSVSDLNMSQINSHREGYYSQLESSQILKAEPDKDEAIGSNQAGRGLLDGTFNEEESHASFLEALNEWRNSKKTEQIKIEPVKPEKPEPSKRPVRRVRSKEPPKKVKIVDPKQQEEEEDDEVDYISFKGKSESKAFFFTGGTEWTKVEMPAQIESSTDMSPRGRRGSQKPKVSCWNCYQIATDEGSQKAGDKTFCSQGCAKTYSDQNSVKCSKCSKTFLKNQDLIVEGNWYCGDNCAPRRQGREARRGQERMEYNHVEGMEAFELSVDFNIKNVMTMEQLEEKYSHRNMIESG